MAHKWFHKAMRGGLYTVGAQTFTVAEDGRLTPDPEPATLNHLRLIPTCELREVVEVVATLPDNPTEADLVKAGIVPVAELPPGAVMSDTPVDVVPPPSQPPKKGKPGRKPKES